MSPQPQQLDQDGLCPTGVDTFIYKQTPVLVIFRGVHSSLERGNSGQSLLLQRGDLWVGTDCSLSYLGFLHIFSHLAETISSAMMYWPVGAPQESMLGLIYQHPKKTREVESHREGLYYK